jgi:hypothetical protein
MHKGESQNSATHHAVTQAQADSCCAISERQPSNESAPTFVSVISSAVLGSAVVISAPVPALVARDSGWTVAPVPIAPVPRHLLLSVFLV